MKILKRDLQAGRIVLKTECLDDLWYLSQILEDGDLVKTRTIRRIKDKDDSVRSSGGERKVITLGVRVEKTEFQQDTDMFRVSGMIEEGPDDLVSVGSHHTFNVDTDTTLTVIKDRWSDVLLSRVKDAVDSSLKADALIAVLDRGEATLGLVRQSGVKYSDINFNVGGKYDTGSGKKDSNEFYVQVLEAIARTDSGNNLSAIIIAGPGFEKEKFKSFLEEEDASFLDRVVVDNTGMTGRAGVEEVLKRDSYSRIVDDISAARDVKLVDKVLQEVGKESGLGIYGLSDVASAAQAGAVETILVLDHELMEKRDDVDPVIKNVKTMKGMFHVVNSSSDAGKMLASIGGIAALLRYKIS